MARICPSKCTLLAMDGAVSSSSLRLAIFALSVSSATMMASQAASAQVDAPAAEEERAVVVTGARLRDGAAQDTPVAVSVITADQIEGLNAPRIHRLSSVVSNLTIVKTPSSPTSLGGFIREFGGTAAGGEPTLSIYIDGVYQSRVAGGLSGSLRPGAAGVDVAAREMISIGGLRLHRDQWQTSVWTKTA